MHCQRGAFPAPRGRCGRGEVRWCGRGEVQGGQLAFPTTSLAPESAQRQKKTSWLSLQEWAPLFIDEEEIVVTMAAAMSSRWRRQECAVDNSKRAGGGGGEGGHRDKAVVMRTRTERFLNS